MPEHSSEALRLAQERLNDLETAAEARGAEKERVNGRLNKLEDRDKIVNGQIKELASEVRGMNTSLTKLQGDLSPLILAASESDERSTARWQKWFWVLGFMIGIATVGLLAVQTLSGVHP